MAIKAGLIGCGRIGFSFDEDPVRSGVWTHAGAYNSNKEIEFVGVYDTNDEQAQLCANTYNVRKFDNIADLVRQVDVLSIAVPESAHVGILDKIFLIVMFEKPKLKIIWMEKPFTGSAAAATQFVKDFDQYGVKFHVNYQRRWCDGFRTLKYHGNPKHVHIIYSRGLKNTASHFIDLIIGLYGMPCKITNDGDDFLLSYDWGKVVFIEINTEYNTCITDIYYNDFMIKIPAIQNNMIYYYSEYSKDYSDYQVLNEYGQKQELIYEPMKEQTDLFVKSINSNQFDMLNNGISALEIIKQIGSNNV